MLRIVIREIRLEGNKPPAGEPMSDEEVNRAKGNKIEKGDMHSHHVHMTISIQTKYSRSQVVGYNKGTSAINLAREYGERKKNYVGQHFWERGYLVSTVGRDEKVIREYIRKHEQDDERLDQLKLHY